MNRLKPYLNTLKVIGSCLLELGLLIVILLGLYAIYLLLAGMVCNPF